jgi:hypothetical protein
MLQLTRKVASCPATGPFELQGALSPTPSVSSARQVRAPARIKELLKEMVQCR